MWPKILDVNNQKTEIPLRKHLSVEYKISKSHGIMCNAYKWQQESNQNQKKNENILHSPPVVWVEIIPILFLSLKLYWRIDFWTKPNYFYTYAANKDMRYPFL